MKYNEFLSELYNLQDLKYKEFHSKIIMSDKLIGVRTFELRRMAKTISRSNYDEFFKGEHFKDYSWLNGLYSRLFFSIILLSIYYENF